MLHMHELPMSHVQHDCVCAFSLGFFFNYSCLDKETASASLPRQSALSLLAFYFVHESKVGRKKKKCFFCTDLIRI